MGINIPIMCWITHTHIYIYYGYKLECRSLRQKMGIFHLQRNSSGVVWSPVERAQRSAISLRPVSPTTVPLRRVRSHETA